MVLHRLRMARISRHLEPGQHPDTGVAEGISMARSSATARDVLIDATLEIESRRNILVAPFW
jgi:hypothetical protein